MIAKQFGMSRLLQIITYYILKQYQLILYNSDN